ncbi:MAG: molybdopterin guanine dinucleotide synthesis [Rubellimicrobium sp.]|nr:molybdopterin guanine dinucleotide synthesis [Rubellimicrobium sp.]
MVDWSGGNDRGPTPKRDAIWACRATTAGTDAPVYLRNRQIAEDWITATLEQDLSVGRRVLAGFDFPFAFPQGLATAILGSETPLALWDWIDARIEDRPRANNRFDLAGEINARFPGIGPFWGNGLKRDIPHLPRKGNDRTFRWEPPLRRTETLAKGSFEIWQLSGAGSVGGQGLMGIPLLSRLRRRFGPRIAAWPFEPGPAQITLVEIWPSLLADQVAGQSRPHEIRDAAQVRVLATTLARMPDKAMARLLARLPQDTAEGWILGVGHETELRNSVGQGRPPPETP